MRSSKVHQPARTPVGLHVTCDNTVIETPRPWHYGWVLLALGCWSAGCAGPTVSRIDVWIGDDVYAARMPTAGPGASAGYDADHRQIALAGAIDETLNYALAITARQAAIEQLTVVPSGLQSADGRIASNAIRLYRAHEVSLERWPGWHVRSVPPGERRERIPDVLVPIEAPRGGLPAALPLDDTLILWVDVHIPKGTGPGTYFGNLEVRSADGLLEAISLSVTVWPFVLPPARKVALLVDIDHQSLFRHHVRVGGRPFGPLLQWGDTAAGPELDDLLWSTARLLRAHQVSPLLPRFHPGVKVDAAGGLEVDWRDYDRVVAPLLDGSRYFDRRPLPYWRIPLSEEFPPAPVYGAMSSPTYSKLARQYLANCAEHFAEQGWLDRSFVFLPYLDRPGEQASAAARHFGRVVRQADARLRTLATLFPQDMAAYGWAGFNQEDLAGLVDAWAPPAQFYDPREMQQQRVHRRATFWTLDRPPFSGSIDLAARPADTRVIAWQARSYKAGAVLMGPAANWPDPTEDVSPQDCCPSGAPLIYPGRYFGLSGPVPSARLKRLRRSMQDLGYAELLEQRNLGHIAEVLAESLSHRAAADAYGAHFADGRGGGWVVDPAQWSAARRTMADEIIRSIRGQRAAGAAGTTRVTDPSKRVGPDVFNTLLWRRFMSATRKLSVRVDGVRVRPYGPALGGAVEIAIAVTVTNGTRTPIAGRLAFETLPLAWQVETPELVFETLGPLESRRLTLRARAAVMQTDVGAVRYLPLILRTSDGQVVRFSARLGYLTATAIQNDIVIDGDLSDWPTTVGGVAEDFVLVTGEDPRTPRLPFTRPTRTTQAFVAADSRALYFGINAALGEDYERPSGQRNFVRYDDGVPVGEELLEILLDPTNAGTRSTSDLYHVVIKPGGWFCERGIATDPPTGQAGPWAAGLTVAVQLHSDRWVAEVRIPLDAFGVRTLGRQIWGINVTRLDLPRQEFSNWSAAAQNTYDPLSLGNLALP
ncbi:MAG: DUF4091 domain-containing protein [Planctomycetes bacterium]|nr:DUF4091 domain-containing protein [Planctomycetota bacterium]